MKTYRGIVLLTLAAFIAEPAFAWNIVCGITIGMKNVTTREMPDKWDADSKALSGISLYYEAVANLQRIELHKDGTFEDPDSFDGGGKASAVASMQFQKSSEAFAQALELAKKNNLGDEQGRAFLRQLADRTAKLSKTMTDDHHLPKLSDVHAVFPVIEAYTKSGIQLSKTHLRMGIAGHGEGGDKYKLP